MGKYDEFMDTLVAQKKTTDVAAGILFKCIANELAEANRLKRIEITKTSNVAPESLEDQA